MTMPVATDPEITATDPAKPDGEPGPESALDVLFPPEKPAASQGEVQDPPEVPEEKPQDQPPASTATPPEKPWLIPGKYRTEKDAIENQDKQLGGLAKSMSDIKATLERIANNPTPRQEEPPADGGLSQQEIAEKWNLEFQNNPVEAMQKWEAMQEKNREDARVEERKRIKDEVKQELTGQMTWEGFVKVNPEFDLSADNPKLDEAKQNVATLREVFTAYPRLNRRTDALVVGKEIVLSPGETVDEKYENWILTKNKKGAPTIPDPNGEAPPAVPGQGSTVRTGGGKQPNDNFGIFAAAIGEHMV